MSRSGGSHSGPRDEISAFKGVLTYADGSCMGLDFTQTEASALTRAPRGDKAALQVCPAPGDVISRVGLCIDELVGAVQREATWTT